MSNFWKKLCTYEALKGGWYLTLRDLQEDFIEIPFLMDQFASSLDANLKELVRQLTTEQFRHLVASMKQKLEGMPLHLRGFSNNRWGGHKSNRIRAFKGSTYGAAGKGKHIQLTPELVADYEKRYPANQQ